MTLIAINQQHPLCNDSSTGPSLRTVWAICSHRISEFAFSLPALVWVSKVMNCAGRLLYMSQVLQLLTQLRASSHNKMVHSLTLHAVF